MQKVSGEYKPNKIILNCNVTEFYELVNFTRSNRINIFVHKISNLLNFGSKMCRVFFFGPIPINFSHSIAAIWCTKWITFRKQINEYTNTGIIKCYLISVIGTNWIGCALALWNALSISLSVLKRICSYKTTENTFNTWKETNNTYFHFIESSIVIFIFQSERRNACCFSQVHENSNIF